MAEAVNSALAEKDAVLEQTIERQMSHGRMDGTLLNVVRRLSRARNFTRMWCAQEHSISVDSFGSLIAQAEGLQLRQSPARQSLALRSSFRAVKGSPHAPLEFLLVTFEEAQCSDPRAKIFALLGLLLPDNSLREIFPNYNLTQKVIFMKTMLECRRQSSGSIAAVAESCRSLLRVFGVQDVCARAARTWLCTFGRETVEDVEPVATGMTGASNISFKYVGQPRMFSDSTLSRDELLWASFVRLDASGKPEKSVAEYARAPILEGHPKWDGASSPSRIANVVRNYATAHFGSSIPSWMVRESVVIGSSLGPLEWSPVPSQGSSPVSMESTPRSEDSSPHPQNPRKTSCQERRRNGCIEVAAIDQHASVGSGIGTAREGRSIDE
ncbi:hypothetical protein LTR95_003937 [Oleoguttula sp. CCFEE 5521]